MNILRFPRVMGAIAAVALLVACDTEGPLDPSRTPPLPPAGGFDADFSFFTSTTPGTGGTTTAWTAAVQRADDANDEMSPFLDVPFAALTDAATVTPRNSGGIWVWDVAFDVDGDPYEGEVRGSVSGGNYGFDLILTAQTRNPPLTNYLWMTGFSGPTGQEGIWSIANAAAGTNQLAASMSWERNAQNEASFAFSSNDSTVWAYQREAGTVTLTFLVGGQIRHVTEWNASSGTGSTWSSADEVTRCWNASQQDTSC